jgi:hypothetical protein
MKQASEAYLQEEGRWRGARPRVRAVLYPFAVDLGLGAAGGDFQHTVYGGEAGRLELEPGYFTAGSWLSPVMQAFSEHLNQVTPDWEDLAGYMETGVYLRFANTAAEVEAAPFTLLTPGVLADLGPYSQVKVEFQEIIRAWGLDSPEEADGFSAYAADQDPDEGFESFASDGIFPGALAGLSLEGRLALPGSEILDPGEVHVDLTRDFSELRAGDHVLVADNRGGQWLPGSGDYFFQGLPWDAKQLDLHHGWETSDGEVEWQLLYQGEVKGLAGMACGWGASHQARLESRDRVAAALARAVGVPSEAGERRPFIRGTYRARAELINSIPAQVGESTKNGSGSAFLKVLGDYRGQYPQDYLLESQSAGEVGNATFRWSTNQGQSWRESGLVTPGAEAPRDLEEGLSVYWEAGQGNDFGAGDKFSFSAQPPVYEHQVFGGPFLEISSTYLNGEETWDRVEAYPETGLIRVTGRSGAVEARVVKDNTIHPVDIIEDILTEVGLQEAIAPEDFSLAKGLTPEYAIGACFENIPAAQALREILKRCLLDLWVDFGQIRLKAYLGDED